MPLNDSSEAQQEQNSSVALVVPLSSSSLSQQLSSTGSAKPRKIELPRDIQRLIFSYVPTFESMLLHYLVTNMPSKTTTTSSTGTTTVSQVLTNTTAVTPPRLRKGPTHITHASSSMHLVEHIGKCKLFVTATEAPCSSTCHNAFCCLSPKIEILFHLFIDNQYIPMCKVHREESTMRHFEYTVPSCCYHALVTRLYPLIVKDIPFLQHHMALYDKYPSFAYVPDIWKQLCSINSSAVWSFRVKVDGVTYCPITFCDKFPTWTMDFMMFHYEGDEFFEDILLKYAMTCRVHKSNENFERMFGSEFYQRLRMGEALLAPKAQLSHNTELRIYHRGDFYPAMKYAESVGLKYPLKMTNQEDVKNLKNIPRSLRKYLEENLPTIGQHYVHEFAEEDDDDEDNFSDEDDDEDVDIDDMSDFNPGIVF